MRLQPFFALFVMLLSCQKNIDEPEQIDIISNNQLKPIYNQAYQENYKPDTFEDIIKNAKNAYVLINPFDDDNYKHIAIIKQNNNEVGAYISIGTGENYRDDFKQLKPFLVTKPWAEWKNEFFVNSTSTGIINLMKKRIDKIADWGCDWVEFDNMDWFFDENNRKKYGFKVTIKEGISYYNELCNYAHSKGLKCMAKNTVEKADSFDGVLYESFVDNKNWWNISGAIKFLQQGKLVIINHYNESNCDRVYTDYKKTYNNNLSFICESSVLKKYIHYNQ